MKSNAPLSEIHLCLANTLGAIGIHCTLNFMTLYCYEEKKLVNIKWHQIREIRLKRYAPEIKFTLSESLADELKLESRKWLRVRLADPLGFMDQISARMVKVSKFPNILSNKYYKPITVIIRSPEEKPLQATEVDFEDHKTICMIAHKFPYNVGGQQQLPKMTTYDRLARFLDSMF